jgi:hypothetical protein
MHTESDAVHLFKSELLQKCDSRKHVPADSNETLRSRKAPVMSLHFTSLALCQTLRMGAIVFKSVPRTSPEWAQKTSM